MDAPRGTIAKSYTQEAPSTRNRAPCDCWTIHSVSIRGGDEDVCKRWNECDAVVYQKVYWFQFSQLGGIVSPENSKVYINRHGEIPHCIRW